MIRSTAPVAESQIRVSMRSRALASCPGAIKIVYSSDSARRAAVGHTAAPPCHDQLG